MFDIAVFGYGGRGKIYADNFKMLGINVTAVCDLSEDRLKIAKDEYGCKVFTNQEEFFKCKRADVLIVATLDNEHFKPCIKALNCGYDVILEKPISYKKTECDIIAKTADETGHSVTVCHVLRYAPFYVTVKGLLDSGDFGKILHVNMTEDVGYYHFAHSYVRGPWRNTESSAPIILAKSCHDLDLFAWFIGEKCKSVSSFGSLSFFKEENAPNGSSKNCVDCNYKESCKYNSYKIYLNKEYEHQAALARHGRLGSSDEEIIKSLSDKSNRYGRCVFHCDNNVYDHQTVSMVFGNDITGQFSLSAFSEGMDRTLKIYCEKGEIYGSVSKNKVCYKFFGDSEEKSIDITFKKEIYASHGGGDFGLTQSFVNSYGKKQMCSDIHLSLQSHYIGFAAQESSENNGKVINLNL